MLELIFFFCLLALGYFSGNYFEQQHYKFIKRRERKTLSLPAVTFGAKQPIPEAEEAALFVGSVVIAADYFKMFVYGLRNLVGGRVLVYESLLDRGRREALLRMKEQAITWGASTIVNVRLESSNIGRQAGNNKGMVAIEIIAYGTGIK